MDRRRASWRYVKHAIEDRELEAEIENRLSQGKRVAIVVNTVARAKSLFRLWEQKLGSDVMCYHSQFIMKDRLEKEKRLTDPHAAPVRLLIATQAIEVSLDISFDVMYSECAPFDALVQRAGRCNRYGLLSDAEMIVFPISETAFQFVYEGKREIVQRTAEVIETYQGTWSEREIARFMEIVYQDTVWKDRDYDKGVHAAQSGVTSIIFDNPVSVENTRLFKYVKTSIIPACYYDEVMGLCKEKQFVRIPLYELPVSMALFKKEIYRRVVPNPYQLPMYEVNYCSKEGLSLSVEDIFY